MIWRWLRRFFIVQHNYTNPVIRMKANGLLIVSWFLLLLWLAGITTAFYNLSQGQDVAALGLRFFVTLIATPLLIFGTQYFLQHGQFNFAAQAVVGLLFINALPLELIIDFRIILSAVLTLIAASLLLPRIAYILVGGVLGLTIIGIGLLPLEVAPTTQQLTTIILLIAAIAIFLYIFGAQPQRIAEQSHLDYSRLLELSRFARDIETIDKRNTLLNTTIHLITQRFHYSFAQVYLIDEQYTGGQLLRVRAGLGLDRGTVTGRVRLRDTSGILEALRTKSSVLLTREDNELRRDYFLAATYSALAIPLIHGEEVLGVLDVQTSENYPFSEHALALLETVVNLLAGKLYELEEQAEIRKAMQEQTQITNTLRQQLNELRKQSRGTVSSTWEDYLTRRGLEAIGFNFAPGQSFTPAEDLPEELRQALERGEIVIETLGNTQIVSVPIRLAGATVGAMAFELPPGRPLTQRQRDMLASIADRLAQALENKRLVEQTQEQALRERKANQAAAQLLSSTDVRAVLEIAADTFNEALGAVHTRIYLRPEDLAQARITAEEGGEE